jgi:hypothetical protein
LDLAVKLAERFESDRTYKLNPMTYEEIAKARIEMEQERAKRERTKLSKVPYPN